jgi:hypothetical protein
LSVVACGGDSLGGSSSSDTGSGSGTVTPASNVASVEVSSGPNGTGINTLYTTVTVCLPGTTTCQTIDNIQVDTGSYGLRILAPVLTLTFQVAKTGTDSALVECTAFVDGYSWGPVVAADVQIAGEQASSVPVQLIGDSRYPTVPSDCTSSAPGAEDTVAAFGANGILGVGPFAQDCGSVCEDGVPEPVVYYACTTESDCMGTTVATADQVANPVTQFAVDNNGVFISLPSVPAAGEASVSGSLIFGIDTESNNASGSQTVVPIESSGVDEGLMTTIFNGQTLTRSFIDSGSNGIYFDDSAIPACSESGFTEFYCPASTLDLSAEMQLAGSATITESFSVANAEQLTQSISAFPGLAGTNPSSQGFDWGLPFFYGRRVATAIEGFTTTAGTGPYVAF